MPKTYIILILIAQINYLYLVPINSSNKKNLKEVSKKNDKRELESELSDDIVIIHTNDVHCGLDDKIGYDGFVLYREILKKKYKHVISVDVGDHIQGGSLGAISQGGAILKIMNKIVFDVNVLGNHEFDYDTDRLNEINRDMETKYTCANFWNRKENRPVFEPYKIVNAGETKIAFIGVLTPLTFSKTYLSTLRDDDGNPIYTFLSENNAEKLYETLQNYINEAKGKGANYVILLTHIGMDVEEYTSNGLISHLEGVNAVLDGHTHLIYNTTSKDKNGNNVYFSQTGTKLESIGELTIKTDGTIVTQIIKEVPKPSNDINDYIIVNRNKKDNYVSKTMNEFIKEIWEAYENDFSKVYGYLGFDFIIKPEDNSDSHAIYCRYKECNLGNLIVDSFKDILSADVAILNGGSVRNNLLQGIITYKSIIDILPFFNSLFVKEIDGQTLLDALEFGVSTLPSQSGGFPQVSGITFDVDISFNSTVVKDSNGVFQSVAGKRRVSNVKINGEYLNVNKKYNLSCSEYIAAGGDGYSMFAKYEVLNESIFTDTDSFTYYLSNYLKGVIPDKYKELQGRINIITDSSLNENPYAKEKKKSHNEYLKNCQILLFLLIISLL